jgi:hypothetical protein
MLVFFLVFASQGHGLESISKCDFFVTPNLSASDLEPVWSQLTISHTNRSSLLRAFAGSSGQINDPFLTVEKSPFL